MSLQAFRLVPESFVSFHDLHVHFDFVFSGLFAWARFSDVGLNLSIHF